jgi:hypothetical protein
MIRPLVMDVYPGPPEWSVIDLDHANADVSATCPV